MIMGAKALAKSGSGGSVEGGGSLAGPDPIFRNSARLFARRGRALFLKKGSGPARLRWRRVGDRHVSNRESRPSSRERRGMHFTISTAVLLSL